MTEHEIDDRFMKAQQMLHNAWDESKLFPLADAIAKSWEFLDEGMVPISSMGLRDHLRHCSALIIGKLEELLETVPYGDHSRLRAMELLTGKPTAWDASIDLTARAEVFTGYLQHLVHIDADDAMALYMETEYYRSTPEADKLLKRLKKEDHSRWLVVQRDLQFEVLRIFQYFHGALRDWANAPEVPLTFKSIFGPLELDRIMREMTDLGIGPKAAKGKNDVVAALHAGCTRFGKKLPRPGHWPLMLAELFPDTKWNEKSKPEERPSFRTKAYKAAYKAMLDRLT